MGLGAAVSFVRQNLTPMAAMQGVLFIYPIVSGWRILPNALAQYLKIPSCSQEVTSEGTPSICSLYPNVNWNLQKGECFDLACKALAAASLYLTANTSILNSLMALLPTNWKVSQVATQLLQSIASSRFNQSSLWTSPVLYLSPVILKLVSLSLSAISKKTAQNLAVELVKNLSEMLSNCLEVLSLLRLSFACLFLSQGNFAMIGASLQIIYHLSKGFYDGVFAELGKIHFDLVSQQVESMDFGDVEAWQKLLVMMEQKNLLDEANKKQLDTMIREKMTSYLDGVYLGWDITQLGNFSAQEKTLKQIYGAMGIATKICPYPLETMRFSLMMWLANLLRFKGMDEEQFTTIEMVLFSQAYECMKGYCSLNELNPEEMIVQLYGQMCSMDLAAQAEIRQKILTSPYFDPIRQLLNSLEESETKDKLDDLTKNFIATLSWTIMPPHKILKIDMPQDTKCLSHMTGNEIIALFQQDESADTPLDLL